MTFVRRAVIFVAQILALISIVVATVAGALAGEDWLTSTFPIARSPLRHARDIDRRRPRRLLHFNNTGGAVFPVRRNRLQHEKSLQNLVFAKDFRPRMISW